MNTESSTILGYHRRDKLWSTLWLNSLKKQAHPAHPPGEQWWTLHIDKTSRASSHGIGLILRSPIGKQVEQAIRLNFSTSNNETEYEVVLVGPDLTLTLAATRLEIKSNS